MPKLGSISTAIVSTLLLAAISYAETSAYVQQVAHRDERAGADHG